MQPGRILKIYYVTTFALGMLATVPISHWLKVNELGARGAFGLILCLNVLFMMLLPLILDWAESRYLKARFLALEELAKNNPQLAEVLTKQCKKLSIPGIKLVVVDTASEELLSYGIWKSNPRIIIPTVVLERADEDGIISSIEQELARFSRRENDVIYLIFGAVQALLLVLLVWI